MMRIQEIRFILDCIEDAECCSIVGLSNMGKSALLRAVARMSSCDESVSQDTVFVYIDFNLMVEMTEQAFYEIILRSLRPAICGADTELVQKRIDRAYRQVVESTNPFLVPLGFNEGIIAVCEGLGKRVILLCDEFDEPFAHMDQRVFLNLRALHDRYASQLVYVVATGRRMQDMRRGAEIGEFCELFAHQTLFLGPLNRSDMAVLMQQLLDGRTPTDMEIALAWDQTGGHPGLLEAVCHMLSSVDQDRDLVGLEERLTSDLNVRAECIKLWNAFISNQQSTMLAVANDHKTAPAPTRSLIRSGILVRQEQGQVYISAALLADFVRHQRWDKIRQETGVRVDRDSGNVWVDGRKIPSLSELEYRLLLLLSERKGKLCDKYQIVTKVWGEDYIDQVDDARIEKLISRLRKKIEVDASEPCYLQTVRGRGYRLVEA